MGVESDADQEPRKEEEGEPKKTRVDLGVRLQLGEAGAQYDAFRRILLRAAVLGRQRFRGCSGRWRRRYDSHADAEFQHLLGPGGRGRRPDPHAQRVRYDPRTLRK